MELIQKDGRAWSRGRARGEKSRGRFRGQELGKQSLALRKAQGPLAKHQASGLGAP